MTFIRNGFLIGGTELSAATPQPLGVATPGTTGTASDAGHVHAAPAAAGISDASATGQALLTAANAGAARTALGLGAAALLGAGSASGDVSLRSYAEALVGGLAGRVLTMRDPVDAVLDLVSLDDGGNPLAVMVYNAGAKTLTAGVNLDITGLGLTVGMSILIRFTSTGIPTSGVFTVTDVGADDPGGAPAVFTRRADFDASGDFVTGLVVLDTAEGGLYRLTVPGGFTLDTDDVIFTAIQSVLVPQDSVAGALMVYAGGAWTLLAPGTNGQVLTMVAGAPAWV